MADMLRVQAEATTPPPPSFKAAAASSTPKQLDVEPAGMCEKVYIYLNVLDMHV
jgi:hypothetical protein